MSIARSLLARHVRDHDWPVMPKHFTGFTEIYVKIQLLKETIDEQQQKIEDLQEKVNQLEEENGELHNTITELDIEKKLDEIRDKISRKTRKIKQLYAPQ